VDEAGDARGEPGHHDYSTSGVAARISAAAVAPGAT
jgi:hypothetical protein